MFCSDCINFHSGRGRNGERLEGGRGWCELWDQEYSSFHECDDIAPEGYGPRNPDISALAEYRHSVFSKNSSRASADDPETGSSYYDAAEDEWEELDAWEEEWAEEDSDDGLLTLTFTLVTDADEETQEEDFSDIPQETRIESEEPHPAIGVIKLILAFVFTGGVYGIWLLAQISRDINRLAEAHDGKHTMNFCLVLFLFHWLTLGIGTLAWFHRLCARVERELLRRKIFYPFGPEVFWFLCVPGLLILIGPFIFLYKLKRAMDIIRAHESISATDI